MPFIFSISLSKTSKTATVAIVACNRQIAKNAFDIFKNLPDVTLVESIDGKRRLKIGSKMFEFTFISTFLSATNFAKFDYGMLVHDPQEEISFNFA